MVSFFFGLDSFLSSIYVNLFELKEFSYKKDEYAIYYGPIVFIFT